MSVPSSRILPSVGCSKPAIIRSVVVLPHPDGPSIEKNSPLGMSTLIPATAATSPKRLTKSTRETSPAIKPPYQSWDVEPSPSDVEGRPVAAREDAVAGVAEDDRREGDQGEDRRDRVRGRERGRARCRIDRHRHGR